MMTSFLYTFVTITVTSIQFPTVNKLPRSDLDEVIVEELDKLQKANGWDWRKRFSVYKQTYAILGWERPEKWELLK